MPVDLNKQRKILVVHGVQTGSDADIEVHETVKHCMLDRLAGLPLDFECELFSYEGINDAAQKNWKRLVELLDKALASRMPLVGALAPAQKTADLIGDVVINLSDGKTAKAIRQALVAKLKEYHAAGHFVTVLAHSLGTIYAFDAVNELIAENAFHDRNDRRTWPVQGLVTIGSPIGLEMFRKGRSRARALGPGTQFLRWSNIWDGGDPVVTGSVFGKPVHYPHVAEYYRNTSADFGWFIKDTSVESGRAWLMAHTSYWINPDVIDEVIRLVTT